MNRNERHEMKLNEIAELAERFLLFNSWGFQQSDRLVVGSYPVVVYDSEWCRLRLQWDRGDYLTGELLMVDYGRLHAVSDKFTMTWNGGQYNCWHNANQFLFFLDDLSPHEASQQTWPHFIEQFSYSEAVEDISSQPQKQVMMHAAMWEYYGKRIFELFDLRRPDLWEKYSVFLREYYALQGPGVIPINPPLHKVC